MWLCARLRCGLWPRRYCLHLRSAVPAFASVCISIPNHTSVPAATSVYISAPASSSVHVSVPALLRPLRGAEPLP